MHPLIPTLLIWFQVHVCVMGDVEGDELEAIRGILVEVQLEQFFIRVRDDLQVSDPSWCDLAKP